VGGKEQRLAFLNNLSRAKARELRQQIDESASRVYALKEQEASLSQKSSALRTALTEPLREAKAFSSEDLISRYRFAHVCAGVAAHYDALVGQNRQESGTLHEILAYKMRLWHKERMKSASADARARGLRTRKRAALAVLEAVETEERIVT